MNTLSRNLLRIAHHRLSGQRGTIDLAGALIGTGAASVLGVALATGGPALINTAHDQAAKQDLAAIHATQSISHAQTGQFVDAEELLAEHGIDAEARGIKVQVEHGEYSATAASKSGKEFTVGSASTLPEQVGD